MVSVSASTAISLPVSRPAANEGAVTRTRVPGSIDDTSCAASSVNGASRSAMRSNHFINSSAELVA